MYISYRSCLSRHTTCRHLVAMALSPQNYCTMSLYILARSSSLLVIFKYRLRYDKAPTRSFYRLADDQWRISPFQLFYMSTHGQTSEISHGCAHFFLGDSFELQTGMRRTSSGRTSVDSERY
jgi:hypothetical protein